MPRLEEETSYSQAEISFKETERYAQPNVIPVMVLKRQGRPFVTTNAVIPDMVEDAHYATIDDNVDMTAINYEQPMTGLLIEISK